MCAIAGVFRAAGVDTAPVRAMAKAMHHRGPDEHTTRRYGGSKPYAALGIERLAIVGLDNGRQPAKDPTGRYRVALNGEIYNHDILRRELLANGVEVQGQSDTAVVAALIASNGLARTLSMCHGMFAMAVLDTVERRLFLVRDRMGVKPLHWAQTPDGTLAFASEIKGLRAHPDLPFKLNPTAVQSYLLFEYIPTPMTIWSGVNKIEPGCWLEVDADGVRQHRWWDPPTWAGGRPGNFNKWARSLHGALQVAVRLRAQADVPVGYLLSGGLDSASVASVAASMSAGPIQTFSVSIAAEGFDEGRAAADTAAALGAEHRTATLKPEDLTPLLKQVTSAMDEPLADSSLIATWKLMGMVQGAGIKCVLSGDGADETLGGYPTYLAHQLAGPARLLRGGLSRAVDRLPVRTEGVTQDYMAKRFVKGLEHPWQRRHQVWMGSWLPEELAIDESVWTRVDALAQEVGSDTVGRVMALDQRMYLSDGVLVKVDRAAGAHGIEVRSPFLDHSMVNLAAEMGTGHHIRGRATKRVLREAMTDVVPEAARLRSKKGFGAPVGPWLRGPCQHLLDDLPGRTSAWIPEAACARAVDEHLSGAADHRRRLWSALVLAEWVDGPHGLD
jgi:asparagine synthase (glutamine-hydrolysing)